MAQSSHLNKKPTDIGYKVNPVWRGVGCVTIVVVPLVSFVAVDQIMAWLLLPDTVNEARKYAVRLVRAANELIDDVFLREGASLLLDIRRYLYAWDAGRMAISALAALLITMFVLALFTFAWGLLAPRQKTEIDEIEKEARIIEREMMRERRKKRRRKCR